MPVFDFKNEPAEKNGPVCTYTTFASNEGVPTAEKPLLLIDNQSRQWKHHSCGVFTNPIKTTSFEFEEEGQKFQSNILKLDLRFVSLLRWLGEHHIKVRLSGENRPEGYAVYKIREMGAGHGTKLSAGDGFLQFMMERLLASSAPSEEIEDEETEESKNEENKKIMMQTLNTELKSNKNNNHTKHHGFYDLCRTHPAGQYSSLGRAESGGSPFQ